MCMAHNSGTSNFIWKICYFKLYKNLIWTLIAHCFLFAFQRNEVVLIRTMADTIDIRLSMWSKINLGFINLNFYSNLLILVYICYEAAKPCNVDNKTPNSNKWVKQRGKTLCCTDMSPPNTGIYMCTC